MSGNYLKVYGANYLYFPWHKPVVYDTFDERMREYSICQYVGFQKETYKFQSTERLYGKYK